MNAVEPHPAPPAGSTERTLADWRAHALAIEAAVAGAVIGQPRTIRLVNTAVFARGHVLLQGDVGVGKTTLLRAFAQVLGGAFGRIEGTVDLMPGDLVYHTHIGADGRPRVDPGPLVKHGADLAIFFFNEINRARPQVHALLLRAMAERAVSAFDGEVALPHLLVFADRNRVEREETFEIASAARDRFLFEVTMDAPADPAERRALMFDTRFHDTDALVAQLPAGLVDHRALAAAAPLIQRAVDASAALQDYALRLWQATADPASVGVALPGVDMSSLMLAGASPRGMSLLMRAARVTAWLDGRSHATPHDIREVFPEAIGHRLCLQPVYELRRHELVPALVGELLRRVPAP